MKPFEPRNPTARIRIVAWPPRRSARDRLMHGINDSMRMLRGWRERMRQRRALARLDERLLRDVGITRVDAMAEANKPFWR